MWLGWYFRSAVVMVPHITATAARQVAMTVRTLFCHCIDAVDMSSPCCRCCYCCRHSSTPQYPWPSKEDDIVIGNGCYSARLLSFLMIMLRDSFVT